jgi:hypothetical protein
VKIGPPLSAYFFAEAFGDFGILGFSMALENATSFSQSIAP